ncbi:MAG: Short-chain dehydrogenase/reductase SDR [Parcubacteria group bacterium GW2011_GWA2_36_24]|nr:MAG: Short-chain dehydrogenase/reductase SDR [Parcubacteria group bacterium GW2011_GWA2_36_24]
MDLKDKVVVITGGSSGLGKATAEILASQNQVVILGRNVKEVEKTSKELKCDGIICNITDEKQVQSAFSQIIEKYKKVDCLINCAGVWIKGPIEQNSPAEIKNTLLVNTFGTFLTVNTLVPQLKKQKFGRIINISSRAGLNAKAERSVYNASKWAITGFTKCLQLELSPFNISVVGFYPGFIHTDLFEKAGDHKNNFNIAMPVEKPAKVLAYLVDVDDDILINSFEMESLREAK